MITAKNKELSQWLKSGDRFRIYAAIGVSETIYHRALSREDPEDMTAREKEVYAFFLKMVEMRKKEYEELVEESVALLENKEED